MRLTTKGRFAVTAMLDLAMHGDHGPVALASISERQKISLSYLEQLFGKLRRHHLVDSVRGPGGGYLAARDLAEISVSDIIIAVDEPIDATQCGGRENCLDEHRCLTHDLWTTLNQTMYDYLESVSLRDLLDRAHEKAQVKAGLVAAKPAVVRDARPGKAAATQGNIGLKRAQAVNL